MKNETKRKAKRCAGVIGIVLAAVALCALLGNLSNGFQNLNPTEWEISLRNENNIVPLDGMKDKYKSDFGVTVTQKDGVLTLSGENKSTLNGEIAIATFTLPAGEYTFTTGKGGVNDNTDSYGYEMRLKSDSSVVQTADKGDSFEISTDTEVTLVVVVAAGKEVDGVKLYPSIVQGDQAVSYYGNSAKG